jgi:hypothetical protein
MTWIVKFAEDVFNFYSGQLVNKKCCGSWNLGLKTVLFIVNLSHFIKIFAADSV